MVERESMRARGLNPEDLVIDVEVLDAKQIACMLDDSDLLLGF